MPLEIIQGPQSIQNLRENPHGIWPKGRHDTGGERLEPICKPAFLPSFKLSYDDNIFCIGSCFAREIEQALGIRGFNVVTRNIPKEDKAFVKFGLGFLNNYGVAAILNELRWGLGEREFDPETNIVEIAPNRYIDLHSAWRGPEAMASVLARRRVLIALNRQIRDCRIVVITLGLSEIWYDNKTGSYLNIAPLRSLVAREPERFATHVMSFADTIGCLETIMDLLRRQCRGDQRILLTVSPVPLSATYRKMDALVANSYSKSVLRAAAEEIAHANPNIDYFPSYESVTLSDRQVAWRDDLLHVQHDLIDINVSRMIDAYHPEAVSEPSEEIAKRISDATEASLLGDPGSAIHLLEPIREFIKRNPELASLYAELCIKLKRLDAARETLPYVPDDWRRTRLEALVELRSENPEPGIQALVQLARLDPRNNGVWRALTDAYQSLDRRADAISAVRGMAASNAAPFRALAPTCPAALRQR